MNKSLLKIAEVFLEIQTLDRQHRLSFGYYHWRTDCRTLLHLIMQAGRVLLIIVVDVAKLLRQLHYPDNAIGVHDRHALYQVGQLADITRPVVPA